MKKEAKPSDNKGTAKYQGDKPKLPAGPESDDDRRRPRSGATMARKQAKDARKK